MSRGRAVSSAFPEPRVRPSAWPVKNEAEAVKALDLTGRERHLRSAMEAMTRIGERFARASRRSLPFLARRRDRLIASSVSLSGEAASQSAGIGPAYEVLCESAEGGAWGSIWLNAPALGILLEGTLGAKEGTTVIALGADLTAAQRAVVGRIAKVIAQDFMDVLKAEAGLELKLGLACSRRRGEGLENAGRDGLRVDCTIDGDSSGAIIGIAIGAEALESAARKRDDDENVEVGNPMMEQAVEEIPVDLTAELGRVTMGLRRVLSLKVGQVLRLPTATDDLVVVRVGGVTKFQGVPVVSRGQLAIEIRTRHEE
jgi:flagellar motor switch protein FliM